MGDELPLEIEYASELLWAMELLLKEIEELRNVNIT